MGCQTHIDNVRREVYKEQFGKWPEHKDEKDVVEVDDRSSRDYNNSDSLKETRRQRAEAKPTNLFHCPTCNKDFKTQKTLNSHLGNQTHIDKERIKNGDAPSKDQVQRAKNIAAKMFSCKDCNPYYFYGSHEDLLRHFTRKKHLERIRPLKEQGEVSLEEHLALDKLKESQQLKEQTQILVRIPGEGIVGLEEAVGRKDGMLMMLRNKKQFRKFAGVEKDVVEVDDRSSIKPRLLFPPKPKEAEIPNLDEEAPTDDEDNVLLFPPDAEIPDSDAPTDDELAPALPLAIVRTTRAGTKRASETLSVGAGPAKRTRT
ncbi:hypothetical protein B0H65DRAFT_473397 [Neurospora tetraspora]|uniref:C2H2-type domain-containing protein n=1 Tax=Neurospora tetraspora TaxID=94610 RepID=A0AAE0JB31_9PEZI|nr:hypothetical protein B0H65DRAFT_473397 [Neurospora tetraspora]